MQLESFEAPVRFCLTLLISADLFVTHLQYMALCYSYNFSSSFVFPNSGKSAEPNPNAFQVSLSSFATASLE